MKGKVVMVTGANSGIGYITSREIARMGAHIIFACRSQARADEAITKLKGELPDQEVKIDFLPLDLGSLDSVRNFASLFKAKKLPLHVLICNAGIMGTDKRQETVDGFEAVFGTNHLGHLLLTLELLDVIKASAPSRILVVTSSLHTSGRIHLEDLNLNISCNYSASNAYANSKLANIMFVKELQRRLDIEKADVTTFAVHPGWVATDIGKGQTGPGAALNNNMTKAFAKSPEEGALNSIKCATDPDLHGNGGKYWAEGVEAKPSHRALKAEKGKILWDKSLEMVKYTKSE